MLIVIVVIKGQVTLSSPPGEKASINAFKHETSNNTRTINGTFIGVICVEEKHDAIMYVPALAMSPKTNTPSVPSAVRRSFPNGCFPNLFPMMGAMPSPKNIMLKQLAGTQKNGNRNGKSGLLNIVVSTVSEIA